MNSPRIYVLIPAHDEEASIAATLESVAAQQLPADDVLVIADNCTDNTALVATQNGATVMATKNNTGKKAGALNQALSQILPGMDDSDVILVLDATPGTLGVSCFPGFYGRGVLCVPWSLFPFGVW